MELRRAALIIPMLLVTAISVILFDQTKFFETTTRIKKHFQVLSNTHVLGYKNTQQILELPLTGLIDTPWDDIHSPGLPITKQPYNTSYKNPCWNEEEEFYCLPYFFIGGFPKCRTTELYDKLIRHPEIISPARKEPHWWTRDQFTRDKNISYRDFFHLAANTIQNNPNFIAVDASASTTWDNENIFPKFGHTEIPDPALLTPHYIRRQLPRAKSVLIVRNPVTRLYSAFLYFHYKNKRKDAKIFHSVAKKSITRLNECLRNPNLSDMHCVYANASSEGYLLPGLRVGLYYIHVQTWLTAFPADQLMVVRLEDYSQNTAKVLQDIFTFLGVRHISQEDIENSIMMSTAQRAKNNTKSYQRHGDMLSNKI